MVDLQWIAGQLHQTEEPDGALSVNDPQAGFVDWLDRVNGGSVTGAHRPPEPPSPPPRPLAASDVPTLFGCGRDPRVDRSPSEEPH